MMAGEKRFRQAFLVEAEIAVLFTGVEQEQVRQSLLGDEPFQVAHVGIAHAGSPASQHIEARHLIGPSLLADLKELPDTDRQRQTFAAGCVLEAPVELRAGQRQDGTGMQAEPAGGHGHGLGVVWGKIREINRDLRIGQVDLFRRWSG
jgi:hypothetical protein